MLGAAAEATHHLAAAEERQALHDADLGGHGLQLALLLRQSRRECGTRARASRGSRGSWVGGTPAATSACPAQQRPAAKTQRRLGWNCDDRRTLKSAAQATGLLGFRSFPAVAPPLPLRPRPASLWPQPSLFLVQPLRWRPLLCRLSPPSPVALPLIAALSAVSDWAMLK